MFSPSFRQKSLAERLNAALWRHRWAWLAGTGPGIPDQNVSFAWVWDQELVNLVPMHRHVNGKMVINHGSFWVLYFQTNPVDFQDFASRAYHRNTNIYLFLPSGQYTVWVDLLKTPYPPVIKQGNWTSPSDFPIYRRVMTLQCLTASQINLQHICWYSFACRQLHLHIYIYTNRINYTRYTLHI